MAKAQEISTSENLDHHVVPSHEETQIEAATHVAPSDASLIPLIDNSQDVDNDGFQTVTRKKNKGKTIDSHQTVCSLPNVINTRQAYKIGLSKFVSIRNVSKVVLQKAKLRDKGNGGAPQSSSNTE